MLKHVIDAFAAHEEISNIQVVIRAEDQIHYANAIRELDLGIRLLPPINGGERRQDSVRFGLEELSENPPSFVLIHDAARPLVSHDLIDRIIEGLQKGPAVIPAIPVTDTLKRANGDTVEATISRSGLFMAQTPQGFHFQDILSAHIDCQALSMTDDASICEAQEIPVTLVDGDMNNLKITSFDDLERAGRLSMTGISLRTGMGYDVHAFEKGDHVMLGGIKIPFEKGLKGHSDADVALHAVTDALLGACALGDIGTHFPPSNPHYKGADSAIFLTDAMTLAQEKGARVVNVDLTIICEAPKITPHRDAMASKIAAILDIEKSRVSVKATTTEGLGFTGRKEGIAAQAIVTVRMG